MTKPHYLQGCAAGLQERGQASDSSYAWNVNFNNGNVNNNHQNNSGFVRACRRVSPGECEDAGLASFRSLYSAWLDARRHKKPCHNQARFEANLIDNLLRIQQQINTGSWKPAPTTCFITTRPKAREIHAPDFGDRVVHHWLVPQLECVYEPGFIAHSYANRQGKGTHGAVNQLKHYARQVHSGQGSGWYLQLDIHNFFMSIHRPTLWALLKKRLLTAGTPETVLKVTHALLRQSPIRQGVHYKATPDERALVPPHKRLANTAPGCGLPIGNLSSQFFANVYLDQLDQFVKHQLKAKRYVRYVDDFVLIHQDRDQLLQWQAQIAAFLMERLGLSLKSDQKLQRLEDGIDFLGYIIRPTHTRVRRRVVSHARQALNQWQHSHVGPQLIRATPQDLRQIRATWASYQGHFHHANNCRLQQDFHRRYPWLHAATVSRKFHYRLEGRKIVIRRSR